MKSFHRSDLRPKPRAPRLTNTDPTGAEPNVKRIKPRVAWGGLSTNAPPHSGEVRVPLYGRHRLFSELARDTHTHT